MSDLNIDAGRLQVNAFADSFGKPIDNALVRVLDQSTNAVLDTFRTNSVGQTSIMELPAPNIDYSLGFGDQQPYAEYNVAVEADGFEPFLISGVQILPMSTALQNVVLRAKVTAPPQPTDITIAPHTLWGTFPPKIPEPEVKELPFPSGLVVLPKPVIPEYIVVHLGVPEDTSARNVWVPYKEYIKNVASCEIYSTWPVETIKANVIAINSFTLNRVFTEWYRGKGFDFTITNSTAFDHSFSYGRNIYEEISVVVDDLFSTYLTKPNIQQPLLAQYCDGRRVVCTKGMQQWGSKDLGDMGYSSINILRNYYGYNVYLTSAEKVEGVPLSYGGTVLTLYSSGEAVRTIQNQLNAISDNYPAISKVRADGVYGSQTQTAVKQFQQIFGLPVTGSVDFATWYQISNIYVAVRNLAELQ